MHIYLKYGAFGWLALAGILHFIIDVASQYLRGKRPPSVETTLYYGFHSSYAIGQLLFGLMCLWVASRWPEFLSDRSVVLLSLFGAFSWLALTMMMEYWQPKAIAIIFIMLLIGAITTAPK